MAHIVFRMSVLLEEIPGMVRAKFKVDEIRSMLMMRQQSDGEYRNEEVRTICMSPVYSSNPDDENHQFWKATPFGKIELGCANFEAVRQFELGKEYHIDFSPA